ncbi:Y-family DNA polymerase [Rhodoplanes sp. Z2-YC6860]|uniref:Y-family DNA polymerase n=1 Tax=Rhodoplanes sp. Z2-YC6860 TaxID=674703 RepID=UPI0009FD69D0|nr:DNA polymerase Y family protein [Rhodoplanes sp. Z2-YC6860]
MSVPSNQRYLSVWLRRLSTDRIARLLPAQGNGPAPDSPYVVVATIEQAQRIVALNDAAARLRLKTDMPLADARAMYPSLPVFEADFEADRKLLEAVADWCDRYTPLVGLDSPDGLFLDITGCAHLFKGEAALARDLLMRLRRQGFAARVAVADTPGAAWAVARYGEQGIVPKAETEAAVLPLPIAALRIDAGTVADLKTSGLVRIADLACRPRAPFAARFGKGLLLRLDQALGRAEESIRPRLPVPAAMAEQRFADPIAREEDVLGTVEYLARQLATILERRGEGGRLFQLVLFRADGKVHRLELGTGAPLRDPARVRRLFTERLAALGDACDPGFGYDMVRLSTLTAERCDPVQSGLASADDREEIAHLVDRLGARFGLRRITRLVPQDTHIPEYAVAAVPAHAPASFHVPKTSGDDWPQDSVAPTRPVRLFEWPERIEAVAQVPDGPPARFDWRHVTHHVVKVEGPERIAMEWWRDDRGNKLTRDYFRVESDDGMRAWLYREGLFGEVKSPKWFLHGLFA